MGIIALWVLMVYTLGAAILAAIYWDWNDDD